MFQEPAIFGVCRMSVVVTNGGWVVGAPLPTIAEVRERWRRELDADAPAAAEPEVPTPHRAISVPQQPRSSTAGDTVLAAMSAAGLVVVALFIAWSLRPPAAPEYTEVLPVSADVRWRAGITSDVTPDLFDADASSVAVIAGGELVVLDALTGAGRWKQPLPAASNYEVGVFGDTVVASSWDVSTWNIAGFDATTGVAMWERSHDDTTFSIRLTREAGVAPVPGSSFFSESSGGRSLVRFAFCKRTGTLEDAAERLLRFGSAGG